ncbi:MAG: hypothetical protein F6K10_14955 [Moorea sp. SIO2B7]|nr:hypothetical protein [Moorena sp. SIO2B7]
MQIYLASSLKNYKINSQIANFIVQHNFKCFLPQRDTPQYHNQLTKQINITAIQNSDIILIVGKNLGNDTAWEIGFAKGIGKLTILLSTDAELDKLRKSIMIFFSVDKVLHLSSYSELNPMLELLYLYNSGSVIS